MTLVDGRVLVGGGYYYDGGQGAAVDLASVELYDPKTDQWANGPPLSAGMASAVGVRLADNQVLIIGSDTAGQMRSVVYDVGRERWSDIGAPPVPFPSYDVDRLLLIALPDGGAILIDRFGNTKGLQRLKPGALSWSDVAAPRGLAGVGAVVLNSGQVLIAGGTGASQDYTKPALALSRVDLWDPVTGKWTRGPDLPGPRMYGEMTLLTDGSVLYAGGADRHFPGSAPDCPAATGDAVRFLPGSR